MLSFWTVRESGVVMKAIIVPQPGEAEVLKYAEVADPVPRPGEAVVQLRAASVNAADLWVRRPGMNLPLPHVPGSDGAGVLESANGESPIPIGSEVVINPALPSLDPTMNARRPYGEIVKILGYDTPGTYAERVAVPNSQLFPKPNNLSFHEAAAFPLTFLTAWRMLVSRGSVVSGETIFVWGASGGLGSAAVKIGKHHGATIIAAIGNPADAETVKSLGADHVVMYRDGKVAEAVANLTEDRGVDLVFESVGEPTWPVTLSILRPGGRVVIAGTTGGDFINQDLSSIFYYQWSILGCRMGDATEFGKVIEMIERHDVRPHVADVLPLYEAAAAQRRLERGDFVGKIVLDIP
jgi:NADPH:quinone reductase-like Zn-dependent oxidoreductase